MMQVEDIRQYFVNELAAERFVIDKTGVKTIEMIGATFEANEPAIFGKPNEDYIEVFVCQGHSRWKARSKST